MSEPNKTIQDKLAALSEMVNWFQSSSFQLEDAVSKFQAAEKLAEEIEQDLTKLKNDIQIVKKKFDSES